MMPSQPHRLELSSNISSIALLPKLGVRNSNAGEGAGSPLNNRDLLSSLPRNSTTNFTSEPFISESPTPLASSHNNRAELLDALRPSLTSNPTG